MELPPHPVHARPDAGRRDRLLDLRPARRRLRVPRRADLHEPPPRRRDQPRPAEDPGGAARGDAGAAGDDRGRSPARSARPFLVLATQNPIEYEGTYPLPEAQLDRFLLRIGVGYPSREDEWGVLAGRDRATRGRGRARPRRRRADADRDAAGDRERARGGEHRLLHRRRRRGDPDEPERPGRREPARLARGDEARALQGGARRARLRHARGREVSRRARPRAPAHAPPRALGAARPGRGHRRRAAGDRAHAARRGRLPDESPNGDDFSLSPIPLSAARPARSWARTPASPPSLCWPPSSSGSR